MNGVVRGKRIERASLHKVYEKGINLPASLFALDINGITVESTGLGMDIGDSDRTCFPIPNTLCKEPWQKRPTAQLLMTMHERDGDPFFADPREVLRQVVSKFDELGLTICAAFELEFYLIDQENINGRPQPPRSPISGKRPHSTQVYLIDDLDEYVDCLQDILEGAKEQGIPADAIVKESAPAQFEVNLHHVADPIKACDYAVLLKRLIKNIAYDHEMDTTFMAKPYPGQAGNGLHVHISLLDKNGNNIFATENPLDSEPLRHAIGGLQQTMAASMAFLCPNVNSYRRFRACRPTCATPCASWTTARSWRATSARTTSTSSSPARKANWPSSSTRSRTLSTTGICIPSSRRPACSGATATAVCIRRRAGFK